MKPRYDRFGCGSLTMNGGATPVAEEPDDATTFCALLPKLPPWKFSASSPGFLGSRSPAPSTVQPPPGLATALGSCESLCPAPCSLQPPSRCRRSGDSSVRLQGVSLAGEQSNRRGSFINKPPQGWLHPESKILQVGVFYLVRYMGCIEVLKSMRSLDFSTRTQVTREAINRLHETVPGMKGAWKKKPPNHSLHSVLGRSNLRFAGMSVTLNISIEGLNLALPTTRQIIANHNMQSISFASGGDMLSGSLQKANGHIPQQNMDDHSEEAKLFVAGMSSDGYLRPYGKVSCEDHMYVNTQSLDAQQWLNETLEDTTNTPEKDVFDMRPFEDALKLHGATSCRGGGQGNGCLWPNPGSARNTEEEQLKQEPWYHGKINRKVAEALLVQDGDFLVRDSLTNPGQYVLTGMHNGQAKHLLLVDPEGVVRTKDLLFESISHLINYHVESEVPILAAESEVCLKQVIKRTHSMPM
ncbi:SHC-transforming protein 2 isoform X3 [Hemitrygon akajei]|uniref:SHC-transforming protein 2 isoform X3 n=1 Tax=Hemitrygon akajei TaxID=2704970 RepID=UPI003BF98DE1